MMSSLAMFIGLLLISAHGHELQTTVVSCMTTKGPIKIEVVPEWAPHGAKRFLELVQDNFYTNIAFFRCVKGFLTQFGLSTDTSQKHWHYKAIPDDPHSGRPINKYVVSYAGSGPNSRSTQLFFAFEDLNFLGKAPWEVPFGHIIDGFEVLDDLYKGYGDIPPYGTGPDQQIIQTPEGAQYLKENYPELDYLVQCSIDGDLSGHLLRGVGDSAEEADEVKDRAQEEIRKEVRGHEHDINDVEVRGRDSNEMHVGSPMPRDTAVTEGTVFHPDFAELKPPPVAKHTLEPVAQPAVGGSGGGKPIVPIVGLATGTHDDDVDDTALFDNKLSDRDQKVCIIFVLFVTVIGMLLYNIWRNKQKYHMGKLT